MFGRKDFASAAKDFAAHFALVDDVANLQKMQKELADAIAKLHDRIKDMESDLKVLKAEVKLESLRETQQMVSAVQGAFHDKLTSITVRISQLENNHHASPLAALPPTVKRVDTDTTPK
jgi:hypothetical protein